MTFVHDMGKQVFPGAEGLGGLAAQILPSAHGSEERVSSLLVEQW